jgi:RNA polymerase sigma-70 factor (ECF subfamily)
MEKRLAEQFESARRELSAYLCRLVVRPQLAEELVQTTFLRCLEAAERLPDSDAGRRAWLFKVATNLAFDELRRHSRWRETALLDLRHRAEADVAVVEQSMALVGSPETKAIAREHLVACLACTLRNLPEYKAAALLLKEVHGFTIEETAELLDSTAAQAKNWLQEARARMDARYGTTCALLAKNGVCYQCVELDAFFVARQGNPLEGDASIEKRLHIARDLKAKPWGAWHRLILELIDDLD